MARAIDMVWIFALGIICLCLVHKGFRKLIFVLMGLTLMFTIFLMVSR